MLSRILLGAILVFGIGSQLHAACVNKTHQKSIVVTPGEAPRDDYQCDVLKKDELRDFKNGYCKKCGCHINDHDNETPATTTPAAK